MGRPRYTSPAEQIVWLEHHVEELEEQNRQLQALVDSYYETCELIRQAHEAESEKLSDELGT